MFLYQFKVGIKNECNNNNTSLEHIHLYKDAVAKYNFSSSFFFNRGRGGP